MKKPLDEWKSCAFTIKPDPVKEALELFMADYAMASKSPNLDTYKLVMEARIRAVKAGNSIAKDAAHKAALATNTKAGNFFKNKMSDLLGEYQQAIGDKIKHLSQEFSEEMEKALAGVDAALAHKSSETLKTALQGCKRFTTFCDGLPSSTTDRLRLVLIDYSKVQVALKAACDHMKRWAEETDATKKTNILKDFKNSCDELQTSRNNLGKNIRSGGGAKVLGTVPPVG